MRYIVTFLPFFLFNEFTWAMLLYNVFYNTFDGDCLLHFAKPGLNFPQNRS